MKYKITFFILLLLFICNLSCEISKTQNNMNLIFLRELDDNLLETIKVMDAYNQATRNIPFEVLGTEKYQKYLMEMTMICMNLRNDISNSVDLNSFQREAFIYDLINSLKPDVKELIDPITKQQDLKAKRYSKLIAKRLGEHIKELRQEILDEEEKIMQSKTFDQYFFHLHSQQFMYQLVLDFMKDAEYLSKENRAFLIRVASEIEYNILSSEEQNKE